LESISDGSLNKPIPTNNTHILCQPNIQGDERFSKKNVDKLIDCLFKNEYLNNNNSITRNFLFELISFFEPNTYFYNEQNTRETADEEPNSSGIIYTDPPIFNTEEETADIEENGDFT
jgi:hypothetical protein